MSMRNFDFMNEFTDKYLPSRGEGDTLASQAITALNKLVFKWFNDGDVFDNQMQSSVYGFANDLSSYANWLDQHCGADVSETLHGIADIETEADYEELLEDLTRTICDADYLEELAESAADGSVYEADGDFRWEESAEDEWEDEFPTAQPEDFDDEDYEEDFDSSRRPPRSGRTLNSGRGYNTESRKQDALDRLRNLKKAVSGVEAALMRDDDTKAQSLFELLLPDVYELERILNRYQFDKSRH